MAPSVSSPLLGLLLLLLLLPLATPGSASGAASCMAGGVVYNSSGCSVGGHYKSVAAASAAACCSLCSADALCSAYTFHPAASGGGLCDLTDSPKVRHGVANATCGCRSARCEPTAACSPVVRPVVPPAPPLPAGQTRPNFVTIIVDDLGFDDTSIRGNPKITFTPKIEALARSGVLLNRHHTYLWCSPTRRSFLTGRFPVHITGTQAPTCSNLTPLQFTLISEKLASADYESHFVGKGHLGWQTTDNLLVNRGFDTHVGYLGGGESYRWGGAYGSPYNESAVKHFDMWHDDHPATDLVRQIEYSTNFYAAQAIDLIEGRNASRPFWLHLTFQAVHSGNWRQDAPAQDAVPPAQVFRDGGYDNATHALDDAIGNITAALQAQGMWNNTLIVLTSDNGGDCGLPAQPKVKGAPGSASNYPLLGRKCTAYEGGTRVAAFVAGGLLPEARRGTVNEQLMYVADWYPTLSKLAGVDPTDDWVDPATNETHPIDGVDLWPSLSTGRGETHVWLPTTERSLLWNDTADGHLWKLIIDEKKSNRFHQNGSQYMDPFNPCLNETQRAWEPPASEADWEPNPEGGVGVPPSCMTCSTTSPCLFDVLADPLEQHNMAKAQPALAAQLLARLQGYAPYVPPLSVQNLACYNCSLPADLWGAFVGPCCIAKTPGM